MSFLPVVALGLMAAANGAASSGRPGKGIRHGASGPIAGAPSERGHGGNEAADFTLLNDATTKADKAREDERRRTEVQSQQESAKWAFGSMIIAAFGLLITFVATIFLAYQLYLTRRAMRDTQGALIAAREANDIARDNAYADRRPWLKITDIKFDVINFVNGQCVLLMDVQLTNYGTTPVLSGCLDCKTARLSDQPTVIQFLRGEEGGAGRQRTGDFAPGEVKSVRIIVFQDIDQMVERKSGLIAAGFLLRYRSPEREEEHQLAQLWHFGQRIFLGSLQPFSYDDFIAGKVELVPQCRDTIRMT
ncbi:hypothetical protein [Sphingobium sp. S6]|uniref:hypothetical protein n=1 Tax=Sphingobium sp. S6 TaxID=2758386 RepID=UPI001F45BA11|nr:hypothetical protein [Sphingobium sp. S6]